jgi:putative ABC transport system permease protein
VAISESAAMRYFGNEDPVGRQLRIGEDKEITVTAVFRDFKPNSNFRGDLVLPLEKISKLTQVWIEPGWDYASDIHTFILLSDNAKIDNILEVSQAVVRNYVNEGEQELNFQRLKDIHIENHLLWESASQTNVSYLYILLLVAFIILLISCINFLFLYIGTTAQRAINTSIKKVFGASRLVVFMEHFREVLVIMVISLVLAIFLLSFYHTSLTRYFSWLPGNLLFDYKLLILLAAVLIIMAVSSAIYPSLILSSVKPINSLKYPDGSKRGRFGLVNVLVVLQFVLCISLITSTVFIQKQVNYFKSQNPGFVKNELITIPLNMPVGHGINNDRFGVFVSELKQFPGIVNATISFSAPSSVNTGEGEPEWVGKPVDKVVKMNWNSVHFNYFETMGLDIIEGRGFNGNFQEDVKNWDTRTCSYILNQSAVREMGITDPVGMEFEMWGFKGPVVGIVEDFNFKSFHSAITPPGFYD